MPDSFFIQSFISLAKVYVLYDVVLNHVDSSKYLGVLFHKSLEFDQHIISTVSKANSRLGFLKRNLRGCPPEVKRMAFIATVR